MKASSSFVTIQNERINYRSCGEGDPFVILPGWFFPLERVPLKDFVRTASEKYGKKIQLIAVHLANLGKSSITDKAITLEDYSDQLRLFLDILHLRKVNLIGHSAGGRIAIHFAYTYQNYVSKLILLSSAGLAHKDASEKMLDRANWYFLKFLARGKDKAVLRQTFQNLYNRSVENEASLIIQPTFIGWGGADTTIRVERASKLESLIKSSVCMSFPGVGHMTVLSPVIFSEIIKFVYSNESTSRTK